MANRMRNDADTAAEESENALVNNHEAKRHIEAAMQHLGCAAYELGRQDQHLKTSAGAGERAAKELSRMRRAAVAV